MRRWAQKHNVTAICAEWGMGPSDAKKEPANSIHIPGAIRAASRGFPDMPTAFWAITRPENRNWRANQPGLYSLRPDVAEAVQEANRYIDAYTARL